MNTPLSSKQFFQTGYIHNIFRCIANSWNLSFFIQIFYKKLGMNAYGVFLSPRLAIVGAVEQSCFVKEYYQKVFEKNPKSYIINVLVRCLNFF